MKRYDCIVLGGGPAGIRAAELVGREGMSVCLVEARKAHLGGTCLNEGCIPVKSLLNSARMFREISSCSRSGLTAEASFPGPEGLLAAARGSVEILRRGMLTRLAAGQVEVIYGRGAFSGPRRLRVELEEGGHREFAAESIVLATGSVPAGLPGLEADGKRIFFSGGLLERGLGIRSIVIAGGGYIGCEFASFFNDMGASVTVVEQAGQLLPGEDGDLARLLARELSKRGVRVMTGCRVKQADSLKDGVRVRVSGPARDDTLPGEALLLATGRRPALSGLNLAAAGVAASSGYVGVNGSLLTSAPGIFAVGDVVDSPMLAHVATREAEHAARAILGDPAPPLDYNLVPRVVFSRPQFAAIGLTEASLRAGGAEAGVEKRHFKANALAVVSDRAAGFAKLIYDRKSRRLLGAGMVGTEVVELIHCPAVSIKAGLSLEEFRDVIFAHPTLSEIWG